jgi:hypothetical protein
MLQVLLEVAFVTMVIAWVLAEIFPALGRWSDKRHNPELARDVEMDLANRSNEREFGTVGTLGLAFAMALLSLSLMPSAVAIDGHSISLHEVSDSMWESNDVSTLTVFVGGWRADNPLGFWTFVAAFLVIMITLFRRSPTLLGVAVVAWSVALWLKMKL